MLPLGFAAFLPFGSVLLLVGAKQASLALLQLVETEGGVLSPRAGGAALLVRHR